MGIFFQGARGEGTVSELNRGFLFGYLPLDPNVHHLRGFQDFLNKMKRDVDCKNIYAEVDTELYV